MHVSLNRKNIRYKLFSFLFVVFILSSCGVKREATWSKNMQHQHKPKSLITACNTSTNPIKPEVRSPCIRLLRIHILCFKNSDTNWEPVQKNKTVKYLQFNERRFTSRDLVFFEGQKRNGKVGHVGIVTEIGSGGEFKFIHASTNNGVIISASTEPYYASRYLRGGRVLKETATQRAAVSTRAPKHSKEKTND